MSAARYVGRVGGLAVALGIGAAFFTGQRVAWAAPASSGSSAGGVRPVIKLRFGGKRLNEDR